MLQPYYIKLISADGTVGCEIKLYAHSSAEAREEAEQMAIDSGIEYVGKPLVFKNSGDKGYTQKIVKKYSSNVENIPNTFPVVVSKKFFAMVDELSKVLHKGPQKIVTEIAKSEIRRLYNDYYENGKVRTNKSKDKGSIVRMEFRFQGESRQFILFTNALSNRGVYFDEESDRHDGLVIIRVRCLMCELAEVMKTYEKMNTLGANNPGAK